MVATANPAPSAPMELSSNSFRSPGLVPRAYVGKLREQVFVGHDLILRHDALPQMARASSIRTRRSQLRKAPSRSNLGRFRDATRQQF